MAQFAAHTQFANWQGFQPWRPRLNEAKRNLFAAYPGLSALVAEHPFAAFEATVAQTKTSQYGCTLSERSKFEARIAEPFRSPYLCALLLFLMEQFEPRFETSSLHEEFALHYADAFNRMIDQINAAPHLADLSKDAFQKDLWIARVVMIPAVAQCWWPRSGLPIHALLSGGPSALWHAFQRCGGRAPFFEGHLHDPHVARGYWSADGWAEALRLLTLALPSFPDHRGAFSISWYFDPHVADISPRIAFAAQRALATGAVRFRLGANPDALANATARSPTRRRLVSERRYAPADYAVVWARRDLISAEFERGQPAEASMLSA